MDEGAKRRLVGAAVLVALVVVFVPMLLDDKDDDGLGEPIVIPDSPAPEADAAASGGSADQGEARPEPAPAPQLPRPEAPGALPAPPPPERSVEAPPPAPARATPEPSTAAKPAAPAAKPAAVGPKPVPAGAQAWVIQVASVGSADAARKLRDELRAKGYPAFVEQAVVNGRQYNRVRVGPETDRARADRIASQLQRETGNKPLVQSYR
jgi:DedD protein